MRSGCGWRVAVADDRTSVCLVCRDQLEQSASQPGWSSLHVRVPEDPPGSSLSMELPMLACVSSARPFLRLAAPALVMMAIAVPGHAATSNAKRTVLQFESMLRDEDQKPVSGIFPMQFELHKPKAKNAFWKEKHWVAIDNGHYTMQLGLTTSLPKGLDPKTAIIAVSIVGVGKILEEPLAGDASLAEVEESRGAVGAGGKRIVPYAEKSGFAYESERSTVADRLGQWTAKTLQEALDALEKRKVKVKPSKSTHMLTSVGGAGGTPFEAICPSGMVAVGIRGGAGIYIDNMQVVCAPLE